MTTTKVSLPGTSYVASEWNSYAEYVNWAHNSVLADTAGERMADDHYNNGIDWPNPSHAQGPTGNAYEPVAYYGTYSLDDVNAFHTRLTIALNNAGIIFTQFAAAAGLTVTADLEEENDEEGWETVSESTEEDAEAVCEELEDEG